jgi:argininosuccinate lyase
MWGGRFDKPPADSARAFTRSFPIDRRMYREDIVASRAHAAMLGRCGFLSEDSVGAIIGGLDGLLEELVAVGGPPMTDDEDIHSFIERELTERIGEDGRRIHFARSRNDQVATDFRLYCKGFSLRLADVILNLMEVLVTRAAEEAETVAPGFTHLQVAQPITRGHYFLALTEMHERDLSELLRAFSVADVCPLGSGALAGVPYGIDREGVAEELGFSQISRNSLDAVADRDFVTVILNACSGLAGHLSRWAEDLVIWASPGYRLVRFDDAYSTGSSMLPQKQNPDIAELTRARAGSILGVAAGWQSVLKGVPLAYGLDMQEDKRAVFTVEDDLVVGLAAITGAMATIKVDRDRMAELARQGYPEAIEIADYLSELGAPFRDAHAAAGRLVRLAESKNVSLPSLEDSDFSEVDSRLPGEIRSRLDLRGIVDRRTSYGGTAPTLVLEEATRAEQRIDWHRDQVRQLAEDRLPQPLRENIGE